MSHEEISAVLDSYPSGQNVLLNTGNGPGTVLTKNDSREWFNANISDSSSITSESLSLMVEGTTWLSEDIAPSEDAPAEIADPLGSEFSGKTKDQRLAEIAETSLVTEDDIIDAGISGTIVFHKKKGMIVKREEDYWETEEGVSYSDEEMIASAGFNSLSNLPWNAEQEDQYNSYQEETLS